MRGDSIRVSGVKVNPRDGGAAFTLSGDLIVDASGRTTKIPSWLEAMGLPLPPETVVDSHTGYASRWYKVNPERRPRDWWWKGIWIDPVADNVSTAGVLFPVEGSRMIVSLAGIGGHYPPSDEAEFTAKLGAASLADNRRGSCARRTDVAGLFVPADGESMAAL